MSINERTNGGLGTNWNRLVEKPVAIMRREDGARADAARGALARLAVNRTDMTREEISSLIESGRER